MARKFLHLALAGGCLGIVFILQATTDDLLMTSAVGVIAFAALASISASGSAARIIYFNAAALTTVFGVWIATLEPSIHSARHEQLQVVPVRVDELSDFEPLDTDDAPADGRTVRRHVVKYDDELIFDVTYTTDQFGLRVSRQPPPGPDESCVLIFGCSFAFGVGVDDEWTLHARLDEHAAGHYRARNFGAPGTGPNHMLRRIQDGTVGRQAGCRPEVAVYVFIQEHVDRATNRPTVAARADSPRYDLSADGQIVRNGNFWRLIDGRLERSVAAQWATAVDRWAYDPQDPTHFERTMAIVEESERALRAAYPDIEFHMIAWDRVAERDAIRDHAALIAHPYPRIHLISDILPDRPDWQTAYQLSRDFHPTALANDLLAGYIVEHILERRRAADAPRAR